MTNLDEPIKVSFNALPRAVTAMDRAAANTGLTRTDALNRAIQLYAAITGLGFWASVRLVWREMNTLRQFAAEDAKESL